MESNISRVIDMTSAEAQYDGAIKEILADKQVLSRILKYALDEFADMNLDEIYRCIGEPEIGKVIVEPGLTNAEKVSLGNSEDSVPNEGKIFYDIKFNAYAKNQEVKIIINIEAQKSTNKAKLGYELDNRIVFYLGRTISSQKGVEFTNSNYDDLKAVKSIWICMDSEDDEDSINRFSFKQETVFGKEIQLNNIHKMQGIIIRLRKNQNAMESKNALIAMLEDLLRKDSAEEKKRKLSMEHGFIMRHELEGKVNTMCNLSEVVLMQGIEKGIEQGECINIIKLICKKMQKGKVVAVIADEIEEEIDTVENIYQVALKYNANVEDAEKIYGELKSSKQEKC